LISPPASAGGSQGGAIKVLAAGRIETEKGFDVLVNAMALALQHEPRLRCEIWGKGDQRDVLIEKIRALGLQDNISFPGYTPGISPKLQTADIAVSSSYREGISNFILESWAAGVPLVATAIEGSAEIVRHRARGLLVPPGDSQAMCDAILELARDEQLRMTCMAGGREALRTTHNWTTMAEKMEKLFTKLLSS
jgi:glycosyltransferase involved in cell wall biosynthesis